MKEKWKELEGNREIYLIFPYDPIRDYTKREVEKINERFRKVESLLGL